MNSLIVLLVRLVFRRYKFLQLFLQLPKYVPRIYVVRCFKLVLGILYGGFFLFYIQLFLQLLSSILQSVEVWLKKHALELFQYSSVLFDKRIELNNGLKAIVEMTRSNISPQLHVKLLNCQATSCTVELAKQLYAQVLACYAKCW